MSPVSLSTMGRGWPEERAYFLAAAADRWNVRVTRDPLHAQIRIIRLTRA